MANPYTPPARRGIGTCSVLGIVFVTLKLLGFIAWSWWLVLAPFWVPWALVLSVLVLLIIGVALS